MADLAVIDVRGQKLSMRRAGAGAPLLFLHGAMGLADHEPALDALAQHFDVIAPDHPGFGASDVNADVDDIADLALFYRDVIDQLNLGAVHLVGHCIGGWIALEMAIHASNCFKSITLVNSAGLRVKDAPRGDMFLCSEADLIKLLFNGDGGDSWFKGWRASPAHEDVYERNRAAAAKYTWSPRLCNPKLDRWLHRIAAPTHVIWSQDNRVLPLAYAEALKAHIPGASSARLDACGHMAHVEQPEALADEITQFIWRAAP